MALRMNNMDNLLATLGEARQNGAFAGGAAGYPWQAKATSAQSRPKSWQSRLWKVGPLAAAAAVAILFVGPNWFSKDGSPIVSENIAAKDNSGRPETPAPSVPDSAPVLKGDYNGDGVVNGLDIQALIEKVRAGEVTVDQADESTHQMLNG